MGRALAWSFIAILLIAIAVILVPTISVWISRLFEDEDREKGGGGP